MRRVVAVFASFLLCASVVAQKFQVSLAPVSTARAVPDTFTPQSFEKADLQQGKVTPGKRKSRTAQGD